MACRRVANIELIFCISGFCNGDYIEYCFLGCDTVKSGRGSRTSQGNVLLPFQGRRMSHRRNQQGKSSKQNPLFAPPKRR
jgi:hypothetical protein